MCIDNSPKKYISICHQDDFQHSIRLEYGGLRWRGCEAKGQILNLDFSQKSPESEKAKEFVLKDRHSVRHEFR